MTRPIAFRPRIIGWLASEASTAAEAIAAGVRKPFPWAIATARGRRAEGPKPAPPEHPAMTTTTAAAAAHWLEAAL